MNLKENLLALRQLHKLSQEDVAGHLNLSRQAVAKWEAGHTYPDIEHLILLTELYGVTLDAIVRQESICGKAFIQNKVENKEKLVNFLCKAKQVTYAGHGAEEKKPSRPAAHDLIYSEENLLYMDTYLGGEHFVGEEALWKEGIPRWSMNYAGRILSENFQSEFLKETLSHVSCDMPYRGPSIYHKGAYTYHCFVEGDFNWFHGREEIYYNETLTYECVFHGGCIK